MYLRTTKRRNRDGSEVVYYQLAHNTRHPETRKPVAQVVHSFGRADHLDRDALVRLCRSIARVCGLGVSDPLQADDEGGERAGAVDLPEGFEQVRTLGYGTVMAIEALWERLGIGEVLRQRASADGCQVPYERALLAMTANRLCEPDSKLGVWDRWLDKVHLPSCRSLKLRQMYEAMDLLHRHAEAVDKAVFFQTVDLLNLDVDLIFYDTTTASFTVDYEGEDELRRRGRAKEGGWKVQVVVALAVTRDGIPVRIWVFPGNQSDVTTVEKVKKDLRGWKLGRALFVGDSGMKSADNRRELARARGKYVLATRMGSVEEIKAKVLTRPGGYKKLANNLRVKEVVVGDGERRRRYVLCLNPKEAERQRRHRELVIEELEHEVKQHRSHKATAKWAIKLMASGRFGRYLTMGRGNKVRIDRAAIKQAAKHDGRWVLETNDDTLDVSDAAQAYKGLMVIERCFRSLKRTRISLMPLYHWLPRRIVAHVKICVLALLLERTAEKLCGRPWSKIRADLDSLQVTEYETVSHRFFRCNRATPELSAVLKTLKIPKPKPVVAVEPLPQDQ